MKLRGVSWDGVDRWIDVQIYRLRQKLGEDLDAIKSVRGIGYLLVPEV